MKMVCTRVVPFNFKCLKCVSHSLIFTHTHTHTMLTELPHEDLAWYWEGLGQHLVKGHLSSKIKPPNLSPEWKTCCTCCIC